MTFIPEGYVDVAYKKLKQMVYYDKNLLNLRKRLAEFECAPEFDENLAEVGKLLNDDRAFESDRFKRWLAQIDFTLVPKTLRPRNKISDEEGSFVSNVLTESRYSIEKVNYLFDGPIELHLIAVLWLMTTGHRLEKELVSNCLGSRLDPLVGNEDDHSAKLFLKYHEQYSKWRDKGIGKATDLLTKEERSICIVALDLQEFYYRVQLDWTEVWKSSRRDIPIPPQMRAVFWRETVGESLLGCLKSICETYQQRISAHLTSTHPDLPPPSTCLPIGLCSSPVIANWYLRDFDRKLLSEVRPAYYGRYVDDILIVVTNDLIPDADPVERFMYDILVRTGVMRLDIDSKRYEVTSTKGLFLQKRKCILQFFEADHSFAGLAKFRKELQENASDFAMLPVEGDESPVEQVAYDLLYEGSVNKLRSVKGIAENRWELAKHLVKQTQLQVLADDGLDSDTKRELFHFFKGRNAIEYWDMWERVFAFFIAAGDIEEAAVFRKAIQEELGKTRFEETIPSESTGGSSRVTRKLRQDLRTHLGLAEEISLAVRASGNSRSSAHGIWRKSNLIRHHLVGVPLLNYTDFDGDYVNPGNPKPFQISRTKVSRSPRFVHFDECVGLVDSWFVEEDEADSVIAANKLYAMFHGDELHDVTSVRVDTQKGGAP